MRDVRRPPDTFHSVQVIGKVIYMNLSQAPRTAILTLIAHLAASENENTVHNDPMAVLCLEGL